MNKQIVWLGRIGRHVVAIAGAREVDRTEAIEIHVAWKRAKVGEGMRVTVGDVVVRACRSMA